MWDTPSGRGGGGLWGGWQNTAHRPKCEWESACAPWGLQEQVGFVQSRLNRLRRRSLIFKLGRYFSCLTVIGSDFRDNASSGVPEEPQPSALFIPHRPEATPALHQPPECGAPTNHYGLHTAFLMQNMWNFKHKNKFLHQKDERN